MNKCIKIVNIKGNNEKIFRALKANVCNAQTKYAKCEQIVDRKLRKHIIYRSRYYLDDSYVRMCSFEDNN